MADRPRRLVVLERLTAMLQEINPANGSEFDLSASVFRGRMEYGENDPPTLVSILESPRAGDPVYGDYLGQNEASVWTLLIQGWTKDDKANPTDPLYWLLAAVETKLAEVVAQKQDGSGRPEFPPERHMLGGIIASFSFGPGVVRPADKAVSSKAFFYLPVRIGLAITVRNQYIDV